MFFEEHIDDDIHDSAVNDAADDLQSDFVQDGSTPFISSAANSFTPADDVDDRAVGRSTMRALVEATENERNCPDILPYPGKIIDTVTALMAEQQARIARLVEEEKRRTEENAGTPTLLPFKPSDIMNVELQRVQFFLCELLRCRLRKIDALCSAIYYEGLLEERRASSLGARDPVLTPQRANLSPKERIVADRLAVASQKAVLLSGLQSAPEELHKLIPNPPHAEGMEILPQPDLHTYIFGMALQDLGVVQLGEGAEQTIHAGEMFLIPYHTFRPYIIAGKVRLL